MKHTLKSQLVVDKDSKKIICTAFSNGKKHDFKLFKNSKTMINNNIQSITDTGYLGINKIHSNNYLPKKSSKNNPLTKENKSRNKYLSKIRILCENVIGAIKRFKIISERYRNRRKRFSLRFNLICGIYNFQIND